MAVALGSLLLVCGPLAFPLAVSLAGALRPPVRGRVRPSIPLLAGFFAVSAAAAVSLAWGVARTWVIRHTADFVLWSVLASAVSAGLATAAYVESANARRGRRRGAPRCDDCGYDLTGNVSGRCPECGWVR